MLIVANNPPHDAAFVAVQDGKLLLSMEGEKDSNTRYLGEPTLPRVLKQMTYMDRLPDVVAWGGFPKTERAAQYDGYQGQYYGTDESLLKIETRRALGKEYTVFHGTHERAHLWSSFALSDLPENEPFYCLLWEGGIGAFYRVDEKYRIKPFGTVLKQPGWRFTYPFYLAEMDAALSRVQGRTGRDQDLAYAGKLMALAGYGQKGFTTDDERINAEVNRLLNFDFNIFDPVEHERTLQELRRSYLLNIGVESQELKDFAKVYQHALFKLFSDFAEKNLTEGLPLVIGGGCGLNCDWNSMWKSSGIFPSVFVPPCTNDSGVAIGYAVDAQRALTGKAKLDWNVYCGEEFVEDIEPPPEFTRHPLDYDHVAGFLSQGETVLAFVQGRYEMGPRALCHRSLIAAPFTHEINRKLNRIKHREMYRPVAPVCAEEHVSEYFDWDGPSPHMLYFQSVRSKSLKAVTHVDNSARVQTVNASQNREMHELLSAFHRRTGYAVLCNTSLNHGGRGFINRMSDLVDYVLGSEVDGFVVGESFYVKNSRP